MCKRIILFSAKFIWLISEWCDCRVAALLKSIYIYVLLTALVLVPINLFGLAG